MYCLIKSAFFYIFFMSYVKGWHRLVDLLLTMHDYPSLAKFALLFIKKIMSVKLQSFLIFQIYWYLWSCYFERDGPCQRYIFRCQKGSILLRIIFLKYISVLSVLSLISMSLLVETRQPQQHLYPLHWTWPGQSEQVVWRRM